MAELLAVGLATFYNPGVMQPVVANRTEWGDIDPTTTHQDYVALLDPDHIGRTVWLEMPDGTVSGPHLVVDCAADKDRRRLVQVGWAVDLSWELAQQLNMPNGPLAGVKVWTEYPVQGMRYE